MISIIHIILFIFIVLSTIGFSHLLKILDILELNKSIEIVVRFAIGIGIISYIYFLLTFFHLLNIYSFYLVLIIGNILLIINHQKYRIKLFSFKKTDRIHIFLLLLFMLVNLFYSLFYPVFYDSMLYHLAVPNFYYQNNGFKLWENNFLSNLPLTIEFYYLYFITGKVFMLTKLINLISSFGILIVVHNIYRETINKSSTLLLLVVYSIPQFGFLSSSSKPDITSILFVLLTVFFFIRYVKKGDREFLLMSAVFSGLSISSKYINVFYIGAMILAYIFMEGKINKKIISNVMIVLIISFIIISPWLVKNIILTGNPVYPYLNKIFKSRYWTPELTNNFSQTIKRGNFTIIKMISYPFEILTKPYNYGMTAVYGYLLITLLIFVFYFKRNYELKFILLIILFSFISLLFFSRVPRYFLTTFIMLSILIVSGVEEYFKERKRQKKILNLLIILLMFVNIFYQIILQEKFFKGIKYLTLKNKYKKNIEYLEILPYYKAFKFINKYLRNKDKIIFLGEDRSFYIKKRFDVSSFNDKNLLVELIKKNDDNDLLLKSLKKRGITHILYSERGLKRMEKKSVSYHMTKIQHEQLIGFLNSLKLIYADNNLYRIYELR